MNQDEILIELVANLKEQNADLKNRLAKKSRSIFGIAEMWKDFWSAISSMWGNMWNDGDSIMATAVISVVLIIAFSWASYGVISSWKPIRDIARPTYRYHLSAGKKNSEKDCFYISQEKTDGYLYRITPCIKDKNDAIKTLREIKATAVLDFRKCAEADFE